MQACDLQTVQAALKSGAVKQLEKQAHKQHCLALDAMKVGSVKMLEDLHTAGLPLATTFTFDRRFQMSYLMFACWQCSSEVVRFLVSLPETLKPEMLNLQTSKQSKCDFKQFTALMFSVIN